MSRGLILFWLIAPLNPLWAQTPCSGIDRNLGLSSEQIVRMKENISPQVFATDLEILNRSGQSCQLIPTRLNLPLSFSQVIY
ncbi:Uncharacterised protein [Escherichia albertii]|nr:Uncharacterised protein [Escherichia coli]